MASDPDVHETASPRLGDAFERALSFAADTHRRQIRKGTNGVPYLAHLLAVASLVLEAGGDEQLAIAALLHDAAEDQGGRAMLETIRAEFGERVARVVEGCTDSFELPKPPWCARKRRYIAHLREKAEVETCLVSAADKLHNARSIVADYHREGERVFERFRGRPGHDDARDRKDRTLWYYRQMVGALQQAVQRGRAAANNSRELLDGFDRLIGELGRVVDQLERLAGKVEYDPCRE